MKKRIISLILVVAMAFLALTGCAYNYAKDDMSKYATFKSDEFLKALQTLVIADGDFGYDEDKRNVKVDETIAMALLKLAGTDDKLFEGKPEKYDALYYCYVAYVGEPKEDGSNMIYAAKMDESKATSVQLGLSTLEGVNKLISDYILRDATDEDAGFENVKDHIYGTSSASRVGKDDIISVSYTKPDGTKVYYEYVDLKTADKEPAAFYAALLGAYVGVTTSELKITVGEGESAADQVYTDVKVESILKDNSKVTVADGDIVFVSYTMKFKWDNEKDPALYGTKGSDGYYTVTVTNQIAYADAVAEDEAKTFASEIIGQEVGKEGSFKVTQAIDVKDGDPVELEVEYSSVKVNWVVNATGAAIELKDTPFDAIEEGDTTTKKTTEKNIYGEAIELNGKEITYMVFPVYYIDVEDISAEVVVREYYSVLNTTEVAEHDHTEEEHEHETVYVFDTLNNEAIKNNDKTLAALVGELVELYTKHADVKKEYDTALKSLTDANSKRATTTSTAESELTNLNNNITNAYTKHLEAKAKLDESQKKIDDKIAEILAVTGGDVNLNDALVKDYKTYQYDSLEATYNSTIKQNLAKEIFTLANKYVTFGDNLPKKAVKEAYKAIMNTYKNSFYEGKYTSGSSSSSSSSSVTNYVYYEGDFDKFLLAETKKDTIENAKASIQAEAEDTVRDIVLIYVLADCFGDEVKLTKDEKKEIKKEQETMSLLYSQYGLSYTYNLDDYIHAAQFAKVFNYLLEEKDTDENRLSYERISYTFKDEAVAE